MAFQGTHIRFALDLMEKYEVKDIGAYISGTLYPDSRYVTKIERELTHSKEFLEKDFATDDFNKGWQVHLLCDKLQKILIEDLIKKRGLKKEDYASEAIKLLQEVYDLEKFNIQNYLPCIKVNKIPNGEAEELLNKFYNLFPVHFTKTPNIENCRSIYEAFGTSNEIVEKIIGQSKEIQNDKLINEGIKNIYSKMISVAQLEN